MTLVEFNVTSPPFRPDQGPLDAPDELREGSTS